MLCTAYPAFSQVERGDKEVSFLGYYNTIVGEDVNPNASGSLQISYGNYFTPALLVGIAPTLRFYASEDRYGDMEVKTDFSGSIFFNLNFSTTSKTVPYITGQYYQWTFDIPEESEFSDYSYINIGFGIKNFINEYAAFNTLGTYGFSLAEDAETALITVMMGLSFIF